MITSVFKDHVQTGEMDFLVRENSFVTFSVKQKLLRNEVLDAFSALLLPAKPDMSKKPLSYSQNSTAGVQEQRNDPL